MNNNPNQFGVVRPRSVVLSYTMAKTLLILLLLAAAAGVWFWTSCRCSLKSPPQLDSEEWWGEKQTRTSKDSSIRPFQVKFDPQMIADLKQRLKNHRPWAPPLEGIGFEYGFNTDEMSTWIKYWSEQYQFSEREKFLNKFPQFKTNIQGLDIHFIRVKPQVPANVKVLPILMVHGWPGSVREFYEAIPLLTKQTPGYDFVFEVIVPSLPGYGFSEAAVRPGLSAMKTGVIMRNLMRRLGHKQYYVQGGDWGALIVSAMTVLYPDEILGHHNNMLSVRNTYTNIKFVIGNYFPSLVVESHLYDRMYPLSKIFMYFIEEFGYFHLQATKPDTIGVALTDSPAGLLAYILEKFAVWTNRGNKHLKNGGLNARFTKDQLIDNLMVYWSTNSITTSMRLYAETMSHKGREVDLDSYATLVPTWVLQAKAELFYNPPEFLRTKYHNLLNVTVLDDGGHFIGFELPEVLVEDVFKAVKSFREFHQRNVKTEL